MKKSEVIVEVTEFDNLRNEYLQQEAAGNDYVSMLNAQMNAEYRAILAEDKSEAEIYYRDAKELISQLIEWRNSEQHQKDWEFRSSIEALVDAECRRQSFALGEDDFAWVYLAGEDNACLHLGNETDSVRLVYTREGIADCVREAVSMLHNKREKRAKEILETLHAMQDALLGARTNTSELDPRRIRKVLYPSMVGIHAEFVASLIASLVNPRHRSSGKGKFSDETVACYHEFMRFLSTIISSLVMAGSAKNPLFRFVLTIPQENEIRISWDSYNCKSYLYGQTFNVREEYREKMRSWWSQSCLMELKRLKDLETICKQ